MRRLVTGPTVEPREMYLVLYGSETGNSIDLADLVVDRLRRRGLNPLMMPFGEATFDLIQGASLVVVLCSTTGQGALPINTKPLWPKLLRKNLTSNTFLGTKLAAFGLGDTSYPRYNWAIKKIHNRLKQLGCSDFINRGEADEQNPDGIDFVFRQWLELLLAEVDLPSKPIEELLPPRYSLTLQRNKLKAEMSDSTGVSRESLTLAKVIDNSRMTPHDHFQDVRHFTLQVEEPEYQPADVVAVFPSNRKEHVDALLQDQEWEDIADYRLKVDDSWARQIGSLVKPLTLRSLLTWHLDLNGIPRRGFFALASHFAQNREQERMQEFGSGEDDALQDLYDYANRPRRSLVEAILEFDTLKIPIEYVLDLFPILRPRQFSIASKANDARIDLTVAVVKYKTILHRIRRGLCTEWMHKLDVGSEIAIKIENTNTQLLKLAGIAHSIICVATGTGIAPIRSLLSSYQGDSPIYLFFGSRYHNKDYLYGDEWHKYPNLHVIPAFSREGGSYVQQQIEQNASLLAPLLPGALIFVCGSAGKMPLAVREAFVEIGGEELVAQKEKQGLYLQETY